MGIEDTEEFPIPVEEPKPAPQQDSKRVIIAISAFMVLAVILAVGLLAQALSGGEESVATEAVDVTTNEDRVAAADIQLEDIVEEPTEEQLELIIESDFFSQVGLESQVVDRLNKQAEKALKDVKSKVPKVDLPETELEDLEDRVEEVQELIEELDTPDVDSISNIANKFRGSVRGALKSQNGKR